MKIRALALAILQREDKKILLEQGRDTVKNHIFYRPLGGGIEFGERGEHAVKREFQEEIGKQIEVESFLGSVENIFEWQGVPGHEIVLFFKCAFSNPKDNNCDTFLRTDGSPGHTCWRSLEEIGDEGAFLYPLGIRDFID